MIGIQVRRSASTCAGDAVSRLLSGILSLVPRFGLPITGSISDPRAGASLTSGLEHPCFQGWDILGPGAGISLLPGSEHP